MVQLRNQTGTDVDGVSLALECESTTNASPPIRETERAVARSRSTIATARKTMCPRVAFGVVDELEPIEIDEQDGRTPT